MIPLDKELYGKTSFKEWASQFLGEYFVMIQIFADESGTHDPFGKRTGSRFPIIAGFAAKKSVWDTTLVAWNAVLKTYDSAPYFHARELEGARLFIAENRTIKNNPKIVKNPYFIRKWDIETIESFRRALTKVAVLGNKIPILGGIDISIFNNIRANLSDQDPYKYSMSEFFRVYHYQTWSLWGNFTSEVHFFFERNTQKGWCEALREVFNAYAEKDKRMRGPSFETKENLVLLQTADLLAYRARKLVDNFKNNKFQFEELDLVIMKPIIPSALTMYPDLKQKLQHPAVKKYLR